MLVAPKRKTPGPKGRNPRPMGGGKSRMSPRASPTSATQTKPSGRHMADYAKQSQFAGALRGNGEPVVRNKANSRCRVGVGHGTPYKVAEGLPCETKPIPRHVRRERRT